MLITRRIIQIILIISTAAMMVIGVRAAYKGHADDHDPNALLAAYPALKDTPMDSCATCHRNGSVPVAGQPGVKRYENNCDYCHAVYVYGKGDVKDTLNAYGKNYLTAGRSLAAVKAMAKEDADKDGFSNEEEFLKGTNPGDPSSAPNKPIAPSKMLTGTEIRSMVPVIEEVVFLNTTKSKAGDSYNSYRGTSLFDLLKAIGISPSAQSVDLISLDGYEKSFTLDELKKSWPQGVPVLGLSKKELGDCGWVSYNVAGLDATKPLPNARIMLAFEENSRKLAPAKVDPENGRIMGTGPMRMMVPQSPISPPDLPESSDKACSEKVPAIYHFQNNYGHNGGQSSFSIVAVRVNPLPKGSRDFEWEKIRYQNITNEKIVFFGAIKTPATK